MKNSTTRSATLLLLLLGLINTCFAQYPIPKKELCEQLKGRILLVEIADVNDTAMNGPNEVLKRSFKDFWTLTPVEFLPAELFDSTLASADNKYAALLAYDDETTRTVRTHSTTMVRDVGGGISPNSSPTFTHKTTFDQVGVKFYFGHYNLSISLMKGKEATDQVCTVAFANSTLIPCDYQFTVQQLSRLINASLNNQKGPDYYDHKKNIELVKTKTLLVPREVFKEKDLLKISEAYEFPNKVVPIKEMNDLVLSRDDQYIYPKIIWSIQHKVYGWVTINPKDGSITSFMSFGGVHFNTHQEADDVIKVKDLKYIASSMAQGINNKYK